MAFSVLYVCTGNVCRSPMAERLFLSRVHGEAAVIASSAGTRAMVDHPMDAASAQALRELGGNPDGHIGRRLATGQAAAADLILVAEGSHRAAVMQAEPIAFRRVFTLREFGRLADGLGPMAGRITEEDLRARVGEVAAQRGTVQPAPPGADDILDPYGAPADVVQTIALQISDTIDQIVDVLGLGRHTSKL